MKYWKALNFDISNAVLKDFNFENIWNIDDFKLQLGAKEAAAYWVLNRSNLNIFLDHTWIRRFESRFYKIEHCYVFFKSKDFVQGLHCHIDIDPKSNEKVVYGLNWCHGHDDAAMIWYDYFDLNPDIVEQNNSKYIEVVKNNLLELDRKVIGPNLTLVNTAIPHMVEIGTQDRWSISLRLEKIDTIKTWSDATAHFS
jgi:hypothetical protein